MLTRGLLVAGSALLLASPGLASAAEAGTLPWHREPSPNIEPKEFPYNALNSVFAASASEAWAVGLARPLSEQGFAALVEEWNGSAWKIVPTANLGAPVGASEVLNGVSGTGPADVWTVGEVRSSAGTQPVAEHWNGSGFTNISPSNSEGALQAVSADSTSDVWAVGKTAGFTTTPLIEHFNGKKWGLVTSAPESGNVLVAVDALSPTNVWAIGTFTPRRGGRRSVIEHFNGSEWSVVLSLPFGTTLSSISAVSANDIYAVGSVSTSREQLIEHWNGSSWSPTGPGVPEGPGIKSGALTGVTALSASDVWAVGFGEHFEKGFETPVDFQLTEHFNGSKWTVVPSESVDGARNVSGLAGGPLFAVGQGVNENKTLIIRQPAP
jgi:hypothetical protein